MKICAICSQLGDVERSFSKYGAPEYDRPFPEAVSRLVIMDIPREPDPDKRHVRRCPLCGTLYAYLFSYEYLMNGSEDEEELNRMSPEQQRECLRTRCLSLESLRREIENTEDAAASMGGYMDRGNPSSEEIQEMMDSMQACGKKARELRAELERQVKGLRTAWPELLVFWADVHRQVCRGFLETIPETGADHEVARDVAERLIQSWSTLPADGETFVAGDDVWLPGYSTRVDAILQTAPAVG